MSSRPWLLRVTMKNAAKCCYLLLLLALYTYVFIYMFSDKYVSHGAVQGNAVQ